MNLKIYNTTCEKCGNLLVPYWYFCSKCGNSQQNYFMQCTQCYHIITDAQANFCPYCRKKIGKIFESNFTSNKTKNDIPVQKLQYTPITASILIENLKFNPHAMKQILYSKKFNFLALLMIVIISMTGAISNYYMSNIYPYSFSNSIISFNINHFIWDSLIFFVSYFIFGLSYNILLNFLDMQDEGSNYIRILASYFPLFLIKDFLIIFLAMYIHNALNQNSILSNVYLLNISLLLLIAIFIFFHLLMVTMKNTEMGSFMTVVVIIGSFLIALTLGFMYTSMILTNQYY